MTGQAPVSQMVMRGILTLTLGTKDRPELRKIRNEATSVLKKEADFTKDYTDAKKVIRAEYANDETKMKYELDKVEDEYNLNLSELEAWKAEAEAKVVEKEEVIETKEAYIKELDDSIKENTEKAFDYGAGKH